MAGFKRGFPDGSGVVLTRSDLPDRGTRCTMWLSVEAYPGTRRSAYVTCQLAMVPMKGD